MKNKLYFFLVLFLCGISLVARAKLIPIPAAPAITGTTTVCAGGTTPLSDPTIGGTWSSGNTAVATIGSGTGIVTGVVAGTAVITYIVSVDTATTIVTVNAIPTAIIGNILICGSGTTLLTDAVGGGTWSRSNTNVNVNSAGVVTGVVAGTSIITYATGCGIVTATVLVNSIPSAGSITGASSELLGSSITLSDATSGAGWITRAAMPTAMGAAAIATLYDNVYVMDGQNSGGCNSGVQVYNATSNTWTSGATMPACIYQGDGAGVINGKIYVPGGWIGGLPTSNMYIYDPVANSWSTGPSMPSLSADGITGVINNMLYVTTADNGFSGYASYLYSFDPSTSAWSVLANSPIPHGSPAGGVINGKLYVAGGDDNTGYPNTELDVYDPVANTWSTMASMPSAVYGAASGVMNGMLYVAGGLNAANVAQNTVYVYDPVANTWSTLASLPTARGLVPGAVVNGSFYVFGGDNGGTFLTANESYTPSSWSSSNTSIATVNDTGLVTGVAGGATFIEYTIGGGCTSTSTHVVTVLAPINGPTAVCVNSTIRLSDVTSGGTWSGSNTNATVNTLGTVTGESTGTVIISYAVAGSFVTYTLTINPNPSPIIGAASLCAFSSVTLSDVDAGTWSSGSTGVATVGSSSGMVTGVATGTAQISYTNSNGCSATTVATISTSPSVIHGASVVCTGTYITLSNSASGGSWSSNNTSIAIIGSGSGQLTGIAPGTVTVNYSVSSGCAASVVVTVNQSPAAIAGATNVCLGSTTTLSDSLTGGTWSVSGTPYISIGSASGLVSGLYAGTTIITYTLNGCNVISLMTVNQVPLGITGTGTVCVGSLTALTDVTTNGEWSSGSTSIATAGSGDGYVVGVSAGTAVITYTIPTGCYRTSIVTVNPLPTAILGADSVCAGATTDLSDLTTGGIWTSGNTVVSTVGAGTGIITGIASGTSTITYKITTGCITTVDITVNPVPGAITGNASVCVGLTTQLSDTSASGTWIGVGAATVSSGGLVTGVSAGTATILYIFLQTGCSSLKTVTVDPLPAAISGPSFVCTGQTTTLSDATSGGAWSTGSATIATISALGVVTAGAVGTVTITYQLPGTGCINTENISVNETPGAITGIAEMCYGFGTTLSDTTSSGSWSSGNTIVATIGSLGNVTSVEAGTSSITYELAGCIATDVVTVHPVPATINGASAVCVGSTITLTESSTGGTWSSGSIGVAAISATGVVTGVSAGTANITYMFSTGCVSFSTITVNPLPAAIAGVGSLCPGTTTLLSDNTPGGTWSSGSTLTATVSAGLVSGILAGTVRITYTLSTGCYIVTIATVNPLPDAISGVTAICVAASSTLSDFTPGGTWSTSNSSVAALTGTLSPVVVTGGSADTATISYTLNTGCAKTFVVTINPLPSAILGATGICKGTTTTLSDDTLGGTWSSGTPAIAAIGSAGGLVTGASAGTATLTYMISTGCKITTPFTVYAVPTAILGNSYVCQGAFVVLSDALAGGVWSSGNTSVATIGAGSGIVTGVTTGTSSIIYTTTGGCFTTAIVTVNVSPTAINGIDFICLGQGTDLTDATSGGVWSCSTPAIATIGSASGIVTSVAAGTADIVYTLTGGCKATINVTVNPLPLPIVGVLNVCTGLTSVLSDATSLGTWSSSNTLAAPVDPTGIVTGISASVEIITYALSTGCIRTVTFEVYPSPSVITGSTGVCISGTFTLSDSVADGVWSSQVPAIAVVNASTGLVTGEASGNTTVTYKLTNGCFSTTIVTIDPTPSPITGATRLCTGTTITLGEAGTGGAWSSGDLSVASVNVSGVVTGIAPGTAVISYALASGCFTTATVTVNAYPAGINGATNVCVASIISLSDPASGGTWSSSTPGVAIVSATGIVRGEAAGTATITYMPPTGCFVTATVVVDPLPHTIDGSVAICIGSTIPLSDSSTGGVWSSSNAAMATVGSLTGVVLGVASGISEISYTLVTGCSVITLVTIDALPSAITGSLSICNGGGVTLDDATTGGLWSSSNTSVVQIGPESGAVLTVAVGTATITYAMAMGCGRTATVTVNPVPAAVTGAGAICVGATLVLSDVTSGGIWSNIIGGIASVGSASGIVTGISAGTATLSYTLPAGCRSTATVTINPIPSIITGTKYMCAGTTTTLNDAVLTGIWSSSNTLVAGADFTTGVISGVSAGTATISYTLSAGCFSTTVVTVNPSPGPISGDTVLCIGATSDLSDGITGGKWTSSHTYIATIGSSSGILTGIGGGSATVTYTLPAGCYSIAGIAINPLPATIYGNANLCVGSYTDFSDAVSGGIWTSSNSVIASVGSLSGTILGNEIGSALITYTLGTGCVKTASVTVNPVPVAISGTDIFCDGGTTILSDASLGGHWTSSNAAVATIGSSSGSLTTLSAGTSIITYEYTTGCMAHEVITVNPLPAAIIGTASVCAGTTLFLSDATSGGIWHSSNTAIATIDGVGNVTTINAGKDTISYTLATGCDEKTVLTVNPMPVAISGTFDVCTGNTITVSDATSGGIWSSGSTAIATIGSGTGIVDGLVAGTATVSYKLIAGCYVTSVVTVNQTPTAINGVKRICLTTTTVLSDSITGGEWTSGATTIAPVGLVSGVTSGLSDGTAVITYTLPSGCITTTIVTVAPLPAIGVINGLSHVCLTSTIILSDSVGGGIWSSSAPGTASVNGLGEVTGNALGSATITYTVSQFCGVAYATKNIVVNPLPNSGTVSGIQAVCIGNITSLTDTATGGIWSTVDTTIASVSNSGVVTGISPGPATISYTVTNICGTLSAILVVSVDPFATNDTIYTHPSPYICANTEFQNFGVGTSIYTGVRYTWSTVNASLISESPGNVNTLISFPNPGVAYVILNVDVLNTGCHNADTFTAYVNTTESRPDTVSYYSSQLVCSDNTADNYQWGYDDAVTLDSSLILGATFQDYYIASPDFSTRCYWVITLHGGCWQKSYYNAPQKGAITSVKQLTANNLSILLYPNPADTKINIEVKNPGSADDITAQVFDMLGKNVAGSILNAGKGSVDISALASGVYSVMLVQNDTRLGVATFVKK